ncbi:hypothetical protein COOONC_20480 [Cooperia oncophora]
MKAACEASEDLNERSYEEKNKRKVSTSAESLSRKRSMAVSKPKTENKSDDSKEQINDDQLETCRGPAVVFDVSHIITQKTMVSPPKTNLDSLREENPLAKAYKTKRIESKEKVEEPFIAPDEKIAQFSFYQMDRSELRKRAQ